MFLNICYSHPNGKFTPTLSEANHLICLWILTEVQLYYL